MTTVVLITILFVLTASAAARKPTHSPAYLAAVHLNQKLAGTPMAGSGFALVVEAKRWNVNPALIAAIAGTESSYGAAACSNNRFNAFGLSSCGSGWHVPTFRSWREAYRFMGGFLSSRWPRARSPYDLVGYAACSPCWARKVAGYMHDLGWPATFRYSTVFAIGRVG